MDKAFETHGAFSWSELTTTDAQGAKTFYGEMFGWELDDELMPDGGAYTMAKVDGEPKAGIMAMPANVPPGTPPHWGIYITVDDVDAAVEKASALGGGTIVPPRDIPSVGRFAVLRDPQGAVFQVIAYTGEGQSET